MEKLVYDESTGCMLWTKSLNGKGYGQLSMNGVSITAHRWIYIYFHGSIKPGYQIDHVKEKCSNRHCANIFHLEEVTAKENNERAGHYDQLRSKTHCTRGHEYNSENTYYRKDRNGRECKLCRRERDQYYFKY